MNQSDDVSICECEHINGIVRVGKEAPILQTELREKGMEAQEVPSHNLQSTDHALHSPVPLCRAAGALRSVWHRLLGYTTTTTPQQC